MYQDIYLYIQLKSHTHQQRQKNFMVLYDQKQLL